MSALDQLLFPQLEPCIVATVMLQHLTLTGQNLITVNTASFTKPHIFFTVRLNAIDIADDTNAIFFGLRQLQTPITLVHIATVAGMGAHVHPVGDRIHSPSPRQIILRGLLVSAPSLVSTSVGWSDWIVIEYGYDGSGQGVLTTNGLDAKTGTGPSTFTNYRWGNSPYDDNHRTRTDLGEMLIYDVNSQYLTSSQRQNVVQYLQDKWNACDASTAPPTAASGRAQIHWRLDPRASRRVTAGTRCPGRARAARAL